ncbi:MAG: histidine kinase [Pseudomonadota bacterium]
MLFKSHHRQPLRAGGYCVLAGAAVCIACGDGAASAPRLLAGLGALFVFALLFWFSSDGSERAPQRGAALLALQSALTMLALGAGAHEAIYLLALPVLWQVTLAYGVGIGAAWGAVQALPLLLHAARLPWSGALALVGAALALHGFALASAQLARSGEQLAQRLALENAQLRQSRSRLAHASARAERVRIARELHDAAGHSLAALSLQLEAASRSGAGAAAPHVEKAHATSAALLREIRALSGQMRTDMVDDLGAALDALAQKTGEAGIAITLAPQVRQDDPALNLVVLRVVQEAITNTLRHARARTLRIDIDEADGMLVVQAQDDGCGRAKVEPGHGLAGMRERVEARGGKVFFWSAPQAGFRVRAILPYGAA